MINATKTLALAGVALSLALPVFAQESPENMPTVSCARFMTLSSTEMAEAVIAARQMSSDATGATNTGAGKTSSNNVENNSTGNTAGSTGSESNVSGSAALDSNTVESNSSTSTTGDTTDSNTTGTTATGGTASGEATSTSGTGDVAAPTGDGVNSSLPADGTAGTSGDMSTEEMVAMTTAFCTGKPDMDISGAMKANP